MLLLVSKWRIPEIRFWDRPMGALLLQAVPILVIYVIFIDAREHFSRILRGSLASGSPISCNLRDFTDMREYFSRVLRGFQALRSENIVNYEQIGFSRASSTFLELPLGRFGCSWATKAALGRVLVCPRAAFGLSWAVPSPLLAVVGPPKAGPGRPKIVSKTTRNR